MMKCPFCGTENKDNAKKCKKCKYSLDPRYTGIPNTRKSFRDILPLIVFGLVAAVLIAVGVLIILWRTRMFHR